jgi:SAM-dependent methyltransferase
VSGPRAPAKAARGEFLRRNPFPGRFLGGFFYREKMRAIHQVTPEEPVDAVLEVGGGRGGLTGLLFPRARIVNIDLDRSHADAPSNREPRTSFVCGDATRLPFADARFDAVTMFDVIEHVPDDSRAMAEALRVLRPGGMLLVSTPNENWRFPHFALLRPVCPSEAEIMAEWGHVRRGYRLADLERMVGARAERVASFITPLTALGHDLAFSRLPRRLRRLLGMLALPLTLFGYAVHRPGARGAETAASWHKR